MAPQKLNKIQFITTITLLVLLMVQTMTSFIHLPSLDGVTVETQMPKLTYANIMDGNFQDGFEEYGRDHFGFREWLIPLYNQFEWDLFKKVERKDIFFGKDNWLYFAETVQDHYETITFNYVSDPEELVKIFQKEAMKVYYLQELLKEYGTTLFICIAPSKNEIYPEYLPENTLWFHEGGIRAEEWYAQKFQELGVNCLNLQHIFKALKGKVSYPLFYKNSSHYSYIAATYAADTLVKFMEETSGLNIQNFTFKEEEVQKPKKIDRDLEELFNLIRPMERNTKYYYVGIDPIPDSTAVKPRWLTIGDSYYWGISEELRAANIFDISPFWYYGKTVHFDYWDSDPQVSNHNIANELIEADIVMLLWCPRNLYVLENGILNNTLLSLSIHDNYKSWIQDKIKKQTELYNDIVEKAKENGRTIEEQIQLDSEWILDQEIQKYFNLEQVETPTIRNERIANLGMWFEGKTPEEICKIKHNYRSLKQTRIDDADTLMREAVQQLYQ